MPLILILFIFIISSKTHLSEGNEEIFNKFDENQVRKTNISGKIKIYKINS
jgi:hypothetical protein